MKRTLVHTFVLSIALLGSMMLMTLRAEPADDFVGDVARGNMAEIALSQMAVGRTQNEAVKQFAQMMVTDHTAAANELQTLATSKSITPPTATDPKHQSAITKLGSESGAEFDRDYMKQMVNDHEKMLSLLQKQADKGTDADLKAFAERMAPIVQGHLTSARTLYDSVRGVSSTGMSANASRGNSSTNNKSSNRSNSNSRINSNSNRRNNSNGGNTNGNSNGNSNRLL